MKIQRGQAKSWFCYSFQYLVSKDMYQIAIYTTKEQNFVGQQQQYILCRIIQSFGTEW
jgi:hypothetical protein